MFEFLLLITVTGLILASNRRMGFANPFQIYFLVWSLTFFAYYFSSESYIKVQPEFFMLMLTAKSFALLFLVIIYDKENIISIKSNDTLFIEINNQKIILIAQMAVLLVSPLIYIRAVAISGGADIFSTLGFAQLRISMIEDGQGYGLLAYFSLLSYVLSSLSVILFINKKIGLLRLISSIAISLFYVYLGTGRTSALLFMLLIFMPLVLLRVFKIKGVAIFCILVVALFVFIASMTSKGVSVEVGLVENLESFFENLRSYSVAPLLALYQLTGSTSEVALGANTFRTFFAAIYSLGLTASPPIALIRDYAYVPDATNVYTVYEPYFNDFSYIGVFIPPSFLMAHWWLYKKANRVGDSWIFYYAASVYPLTMQFFQDQYFSLLSTWVQVAFWYWLFLMPKKIRFSKIGIYSA